MISLNNPVFISSIAFMDKAIISRLPLFAACAIAFTALGADKPKNDPPPPPTYTTPEQGGRDYADQGEYQNDWGGAQVIALGKDRFRLIVYPGGLPGNGWDKSEQNPVEGKRDGSQVVFASSGSGFKYRIENGVLHATSPNGDEYTMNKVARQSPTLGAKPPANAVVLFDGSGTDEWRDAHMDARKFLAAGATTKRSFTNFTIHLEFLVPFRPEARGQERGNSGVYLQDRYEVQVLDSFGLKSKSDDCGGIYGQATPSVNMCYPPLTWQTYDIDYTAAEFDSAGKKTRNATATIRQNGTVIHDQLQFKGPTGGGKKESPVGGGIQLQGHGNPVFYRNIWIVPK